VGVSSFGYSGTIAHSVLHHTQSAIHITTHPQAYKLHQRRRAFIWREAPHPFAQLQSASTDAAPVFHSPAASFAQLVADHVVRGRVIFPGAGYLELARAAATSDHAALHGVFFLQPLAVEAAGLLVECSVAEGRFEVRSGEEGAMADAAVHCSGALGADQGWQPMSNALVRGGSCACAADVGALYGGFDAAGLQYGPGYRTLVQAWSGVAGVATARLHARSDQQGTRVHPADLDDALCLGALASGVGGDGATRLPFAVDDARLQGAEGRLWAVRTHSPVALALECTELPCAVMLATRVCWAVTCC
jgi:acyl transferase domain-containing protein